MRKFYVGLISLAAVLAIYVLFGRVNKPPIDTGSGDEFIDAVADSNLGVFDSKAGMIGEVGVGTARKARYIDFNKDTKEVEREWGFERLLHEVRDIWEIEKPYMNIYRRNFKCYITADSGKIRVETAVGKSTPKDATFTGNVVVHILPEGSGNIKESHIYLDDFFYLSEKSQLSTANSVKFVSEDAQMFGTGLELVYDEELERLEYLRIIDVESLHIKNSQTGFLSGSKKQADSPAKTQQPGEPAVAVDKGQVQPAVAQPMLEQEKGEYYKCVFGKNVLIDSPEQLVFAHDKISINDIFWSKASSSQSNKADADAGTAENSQSYEADDGTRTTEQGPQGAEDTNTYNVADATQNEPNKSPEKFEDIVVTCDNGFIVVPKDSSKTLENPPQTGTGANAAGIPRPKKFDQAEGKNTFSSRRVDYSAPTGDAVAVGLSELIFYTGGATSGKTDEALVPVKVTAQDGVKFFQASSKAVFEGDCLCVMPQAGLSEPKNATLSAPKITVNLLKDKAQQSSALSDILAAGPAELTFYVEDSNGPETKKTIMPAKVTAQEYARFVAASNQVIFEGDCLWTMLREDPNVHQKYTLSAPKLTIDLPKDTNDQSSTLTAGIEHFTADGGLVRLRSIKTAKQMSLGGIELEARKFDYDPRRGLFIATGPGIIRVDNSKITQSVADAGKFSLSKPCYAFLREFETLEYFLQENRIVADAGSERLFIDYFPVVDGKYGRQIQVEAGHVEALLTETAEGQTELLTLTATGGILYEDEDNENEFMGSELFYDHKKSIVKINGDQSQPCYYNGALVDEIEYDLKSGKVKVTVVGPGALQL